MSNQDTQTAIAPRASALAIMADRCSVDPAKLHLTLKNTVFKGASDDELLALVVTANIYQLNPFLKEIYAFPKKGGGIVPLVGFDGWVKIANRQPNLDGMDVEVFGNDKNPTHAVCKIYLKNRSRPVEITEYFSECHRNTDPWNQMPRRMLRNKAVIQAVRIAFGVAGIHDEDDANDMTMRDVTPTHNVSAPAEVAAALAPRRGRPPKQESPVEIIEDAPGDSTTQEVTLVGIGVEKRTQRDGKTPYDIFVITYNNGFADCQASTISRAIVEPVNGLAAGAKISIAVEPRNIEGESDKLVSLVVIGGEA